MQLRSFSNISVQFFSHKFRIKQKIDIYLRTFQWLPVDIGLQRALFLFLDILELVVSITKLER